MSDPYPGVTTTRLLRLLGSRIVADNGTTVEIDVALGTTVVKARSELRAWCIKRLETRATHTNRSIRGAGTISRKW